MRRRTAEKEIKDAGKTWNETADLFNSEMPEFFFFFGALCSSRGEESGWMMICCSLKSKVQMKVGPAKADNYFCSVDLARLLAASHTAFLQ